MNEKMKEKILDEVEMIFSDLNEYEVQTEHEWELIEKFRNRMFDFIERG